MTALLEEETNDNYAGVWLALPNHVKYMHKALQLIVTLVVSEACDWFRRVTEEVTSFPALFMTFLKARRLDESEERVTLSRRLLMTNDCCLRSHRYEDVSLKTKTLFRREFQYVIDNRGKCPLMLWVHLRQLRAYLKMHNQSSERMNKELQAMVKRAPAMKQYLANSRISIRAGTEVTSAMCAARHKQVVGFKSSEHSIVQLDTPAPIPLDVPLGPPPTCEHELPIQGRYAASIIAMMQRDRICGARYVFQLPPATNRDPQCFLMGLSYYSTVFCVRGIIRADGADDVFFLDLPLAPLRLHSLVSDYLAPETDDIRERIRIKARDDFVVRVVRNRLRWITRRTALVRRDTMMTTTYKRVKPRPRPARVGPGDGPLPLPPGPVEPHDDDGSGDGDDYGELARDLEDLLDHAWHEELLGEVPEEEEKREEEETEAEDRREEEERVEEELAAPNHPLVPMDAAIVRSIIDVMNARCAILRNTLTNAKALVVEANRALPRDEDISLIMERIPNEAPDGVDYDCTVLFVRWTDARTRFGRRCDFEYKALADGDFNVTVKWNIGLVPEVSYFGCDLLMHKAPFEVVKLRYQRDPVPKWALVYKRFKELELFAGPIIRPDPDAEACQLCKASEVCGVPLAIEGEVYGCLGCTGFFHGGCARWLWARVRERPPVPWRCTACMPRGRVVHGGEGDEDGPGRPGGAAAKRRRVANRVGTVRARYYAPTNQSTRVHPPIRANGQTACIYIYVYI